MRFTVLTEVTWTRRHTVEAASREAVEAIMRDVASAHERDGNTRVRVVVLDDEELTEVCHDQP